MEDWYLFSYCVRTDDGVAPNPYGGVCTLAICKPAIRRTARIGDWILGHGSKEHNSSNKLIYAMQIDRVLTLQDYDRYCQKHLPEKLPNPTSFQQAVGDSIYDFSVDPPNKRSSVHDSPENFITDMSGINVLLSKHFLYFGDKAILIPENLRDVLHPNQGHKKQKNDPYKEVFLKWINSVANNRWNLIQGNHEGMPDWLKDPESACKKCSAVRAEDDKHDREC